jgi:hypothetical protein
MAESYSRRTPRFKHFAFCLPPFSFAEGAGWLVWSELGQGVTRPDILTKIKILGS